MPPITATAINCSLSARGRKSSTDAMLAVLTEHFEAEGVRVGKPIRIAAHSIKWGVTSNEGAGDEWPKIREAILSSDILIFGTPIWMGQASSVAKLVMERMDAFLSETDDKGRMPSFSKVAVAAIVGNEDGAHNASSQIFQALNDVGWTIPAVAACYWVGEAMGSVDFKDLQHRPSKVTETAKMVAANATHLARLLRESPYPG
ncbi:flavodoxin family protein [Sphingopyxis macrogoltabida]|jgi:multimeric flavodoxin WrbA|uniref:Flavodoxin n=1 Tax=Sphingopyxis macrogoltabida TaxID=33050 RepID=A0AAC9AUX5_SPHMC|nr:NAD(P)H-dependent oxidoreductase [Sphingopyxis macrogoltabida]ALJ13497.1 flavodoxin [Sphingopyxis macrogoltabida]AMU89045.1 flavodoxin [Sphingopyxis macrogoltabida]